MFNAPRAGQRYLASSTNGFGGSVGNENPLASSVYDDGLDPWSAAPSPVPTPAPNNPSSSSTFSSVIADATVPAIYHRAFAAVDPSGLGDTSVNSLSRVLAASGLPAGTVDRIVNLVSSRPRVSKLEFFVALALVALAQTNRDVSIEQVAALSSEDALPEPALDLDRLQASNSTFTVPTVPYRQNTVDPWNATPKYGPSQNPSSVLGVGGSGGLTGGLINGTQSSLSGTGLPPEWWKRLEGVKVTILGQQGFILNRYTVYEIMNENGVTVTRRYSEFVYLWEVLLRRYPFRLFPALPPKRVGPDEHFLEQRRRGLQRALNFVINHPVLKEDAVLTVFLTVSSFETWRKQTSISLDEESLSRRVDRVEEMSIPSDFEDKLTVVRVRLGPLIEQWQRICILAERIMKRQEAAAVRSPLAFKRAYLPTHFILPLSSTSTSPSGSSLSIMSPSMNHSFLGLHLLPTVEEQSDLSRLTNTLRAVTEVNEHCWRGDECELSNGVRHGLDQLASHTQRHSDLAESRIRTRLDTTLESLKAQRDLYLATRDLFVRHERLSVDQVDRLRKRVDTNSVKLDGIRSTAKEGWQDEAEKLTAMIEKDQGTIAAQLSRRVFIRVCMWNELRIILHNRENALLTLAVKKFAREEQEHAEWVLKNWTSLGESIENMPYE